jgi:predicted alpha/beta hydrolase family esterase
MKNALILHGMPDKEEYYSSGSSPANSHWLPWLKQELTARGISTQCPEFPVPYAPVYENWKATFEQYSVDPETVLIGHSCGAGFIVRWLSENKSIRVGKVLLVAPWLDPDKQLEDSFFSFTIDSNLRDRTAGIQVLYSLDDGREVHESVHLLREKINAEFLEYANKGHFTFEDLGTIAAPEILELILK